MNIKQKVELLEEKLRKNFYYWLDLCSRKILKEVTFDGDIIIIIEALEQFKDPDSGLESNLRFWLPRVFPNRIRFIVTADPGCDSYAYLKSIKCETLHVSVERSLYTSIINSLKDRKHFCTEEHHRKCYEMIQGKFEENKIDNALYIKTFCSAFVPYESLDLISENELPRSGPGSLLELLSDFDYEIVDGINHTDELMDYILEYYEGRLMHRDKFMKTCVVLNLTFKGLSRPEMNRIMDFKQYEWELLIAIFKSFFFVYQGFWKVSNEIFKKAVNKRYMCDEVFNTQIHLDIVTALEPTPNSVRKQEEITSHLYRAKKFNELKQVLASIETFLL